MTWYCESTLKPHRNRVNGETAPSLCKPRNRAEIYAIMIYDFGAFYGLQDDGAVSWFNIRARFD